MLEIKKIFYRTVVAVCCGLLPFGCVKKEFSASDIQRNVAVRLNVGTRAVDAADGTPTSDESALHSLRVYAFVEGRLVGHEFRNGDMTAPATFWMDLAMTSLDTETVDFYLIANEKAMSNPGVGINLTENTTESQLNNVRFTTLNAVGTYGLPMFCKETREIDFSKDSQTPLTDPDHSGHTPLEEVLTFTLKRPVGKLGIFAAKDADDNGVLQVTGLTMLEAGTLAYNYLMPQTPETLKQVGNGSGDIHLTPSLEAVTKELAANITPEQRRHPENYTPVLDAPFYPFESPWGSTDWSAPGDAKGNILKIDYTFDGEPREGLVYMPPIERNHYYAVCCLMHNSGKITVVYDVADWEYGGNYVLEFDYPSYDLVQPFAGGTAPYAQPTVYYNVDQSSTAGSYSFRFTIRGPEGQEWTPTLFDATDADYELTVYQNKDGNTVLVSPPYKASDTPYEIRVRALQNDAEYLDKEFSLGIAYTPKWDPLGSSLLLINMQDGTTNWTGSASTEKIVIKQVDIPTN